MSSGCQVRVAGVGDASEIAELRALWTAVDLDPAFEAEMASWLTSEGDRRTTWLAYASARAVGMASLLEYRRMPRPGRLLLSPAPDAIGFYARAGFVSAGEEAGEDRLMVRPG